MKRALRWLALLALLFGIVLYLRPLWLYAALRTIQLWAMGARSETVQVAGNRIHYYVLGEGPPLVVLHGIGSRASDLTPTLKWLARTRRVYAPDLLGFGESQRPDIAYSISDQTNMVLGYLDAMKLEQPEVFGLSMGGWIAAKLAAEHPSRVKRLILISSAGLSFRNSLNNATFTPKTIDDMRALIALQTDHAALVPDFILRDFLRVGREKRWVMARSTKSMLSGRDLLDGKLGTATMPALLVWGTKDRLVPVEVGRRMARELPHAELVEADGCGHLALFECEEKVTAAVSRFLAHGSSAAR